MGTEDLDQTDLERRDLAVPVGLRRQRQSANNSTAAKLMELTHMKIPVRSSWTWKPTYTFARLIVGLHQSVNRRFGIWLRPDRCAFVSFLYRIDSSKPDAFSQNKPAQDCES